MRHPDGFSPDVVEAISFGYEEWKRDVTILIESWGKDSFTRRLRKPEYTFGLLELSDDGTVLSFALDGDPYTYGALKMIEDVFPSLLVKYLPRRFVENLEIAYENPAMGHFGEWVSFPDSKS